MLSRLLGLLVLSSISSAMFDPNMTTKPEDKMTSDPNTYISEESSGMPPFRGNLTQARMHVPGHPGDMGMDMDMDPNYEICHLLLNSPNPPPAAEIPWFCLCWQCKGTTGPKGDRGDRGSPGAPGSAGQRGMMGFRGRTGFTGPQGFKGQKGELGEKGQDGMMGSIGMKGGRGFKGEKGDRGLEGPAGTQGPQGESGTCPAACDSAQGEQGEPGLPGEAGARGLPGVAGPRGPKGDMGDKGNLGMDGAPGVNGEKGDQGEQGVCDCVDGTDGADGQRGPSGDKGNKGDMGTAGIQGVKGDKGGNGEMGQMGIPGPCTPAIQSGFSVALNESNPKPDWPVQFPLVISNLQGHFDTSFGVYTVRVGGTYVFTYHLAVQGGLLKVGLFVNFYPIVRSTESSSSVSHTIVLHLEMNDEVWLQVKDSTTNNMFTDEENTSTFSGYLLYPDTCDVMVSREFSQPEHQKGTYVWEPTGAPPTTQTHSP